MVAKQGKVMTIPTWRFETEAAWQEAISGNDLPFPMIQKPKGGILGKDVFYLKSAKEIKDLDNIKRYVFQTFIPNDGDFRVIMIGGKMIGAMKRVPAEGKITNNIGQGGSGHTVTDKQELAELKVVSEEVAKVFPLDVAGLDVIYNQDDGKYYFLEINISPQWREFQRVTGIDVGEAIIKMCQRLYNDRS